MLNLTIKNISEPLHQQLKENALRHHRSLNSEAIVCLENALIATAPLNVTGFLMRARNLRKKVTGVISNNRLNRLKRAGRS